MRINQSLDGARQRLWEKLERGEIVTCYCCGQTCKIYPRKINSGMARSLIQMYQLGGRDWVHLPTRLNLRSREEGKLAYWGLVEEQKVVRSDGGRAGWWRITEKGEAFVKNQLQVPKIAMVYNGTVREFDDSQMVGIKDALGDKFSYDELMAYTTKLRAV